MLGTGNAACTVVAGLALAVVVGSGGVLENCGGRKRLGGLPGRLNDKFLFK